MKLKLFSEYRGLRKELYILFLGRVMTNFGSMIWPVLTLILSNHLGFTATQISIYFLIFTAVMIPVVYFGGRLADKYNKKNIIVICDTISIAGYIACAFFPVNLVSVIIVSLAAMFQTMENPSYEALISDFTTSQDRDRAYSLSYLGSNLGLMLSPTIASFLVNDFLWLSFLICGFSIAISTIMIFIFIKNVDKEVDEHNQSIYEKDIEQKSSTIKYLLKNKILLIVFIGSAIWQVVYGTYYFLMPLDLTAAYGNDLGAKLFGTMNSVNCILVVVCTALITRLFRKLFDTKKMVVGQILSLIGLLIFVLTVRTAMPAWGYVAITIFTWGEIFNTISQTPFISKRIPASHRGRVMSIFYIGGSVLSSSLQIGIGALYDIKDSGPYIAWAVIGGLAIITILIFFIVSKIDVKYYRNLYYGREGKDGHYISVKTMIPSLYEEYYKTYINNEGNAQESWNRLAKQKNKRNLFIMYDATPIGEITYSNINFRDETADLLINIRDKSMRNKGIGSIAQEISINYAFERFGISTINAKVKYDDVVYIHVLEKNGFILNSVDDKFVYYQLESKKA